MPGVHYLRVGHLFSLYEKLTEEIQARLPNLYLDLPKIKIPKPIDGHVHNQALYE